MIKLLEKLRENNSNFDNIWNEDGRDTQEYMVKNAPQMLSRLSEWYVNQGKLIKDLERTVKEEI